MGWGISLWAERRGMGDRGWGLGVACFPTPIPFLAREQLAAAIHAQHLAVDEARGVATQERNPVGDLRGQAVALERYGRVAVARVGLAGGQEARRHRRAGADGVDAYAVRAQLLRQAARLLFYRYRDHRV